MGALGSVVPLLLLLPAVLLLLLLQVVAAAAPRSQPPSAGEARIGEWGAGRGAQGGWRAAGPSCSPPALPRDLPASHGRPRPSSAHLTATGILSSPPGSPAPSRLARVPGGMHRGGGTRLLGSPQRCEVAPRPLKSGWCSGEAASLEAFAPRPS